MITQELLKELLHYDPLSGIFTNKVNRGTRAIKGEQAGHVDTQGYVIINIDYKKYAAHRFAYLYMTGDFPKNDIDHIDHNKSNNKWSNIRSVSIGDNSKNLPKRKDNTSGFTGVSWSKNRNRWRAEITVNKKIVRLGEFFDLSDAINARKQANIKYNFHSNHGY